MRGGWESLLHPQPNLLYGIQLLVLPRLLPSKSLILPFQRLIVPRQRLIMACQCLILEVHASVESVHRMGFAPMNIPALPPVILCQYASTAASESKSLGRLRDGMVAFIGCCEGSYELIHHRYIGVIPPAEEVIPKWLRCHPLNLLPTSIRIQQWEIKVKTTRDALFC
nr:hypothetical protein Iba_scaffold10239CG0010 [Ipomoea batatas]